MSVAASVKYEDRSDQNLCHSERMTRSWVTRMSSGSGVRGAEDGWV
jgi:hypothetical protein